MMAEEGYVIGRQVQGRQDQWTDTAITESCEEKELVQLLAMLNTEKGCCGDTAYKNMSST